MRTRQGTHVDDVKRRGDGERRHGLPPSHNVPWLVADEVVDEEQEAELDRANGQPEELGARDETCVEAQDSSGCGVRYHEPIRLL